MKTLSRSEGSRLLGRPDVAAAGPVSAKKWPQKLPKLHHKEKRVEMMDQRSKAYGTRYAWGRREEAPAEKRRAGETREGITAEISQY